MPPSMSERVAERYPDLLPLLRHPEIGKLLTQAVNKSWSPGVFQSKLRASRWFRSQSASQRQWWVTRTSDPGEAKLQRNVYSAEIAAVASRLGVKLSPAEIKYITESGLARGDDPGSQRVLQNLLAYGKRKKGGIVGGAYRTAQKAITDSAASEWFSPVSWQVKRNWATWIALDQKTMDDWNEAMAHSAMMRFPHMADQIKAGQTVAQIAGPNIAAYAREMDWTPEQVAANLARHGGKWTQLLGVRDSKTNKMRMPTEYEAQTMARQRGDWWGTTSGRQSDAAMSQSLLQAFGRRA